MSMNCATSSTKASVVAHNGHATTCTANVDHLINVLQQGKLLRICICATTGMTMNKKDCNCGDSTVLCSLNHSICRCTHGRVNDLVQARGLRHRGITLLLSHTGHDAELHGPANQRKHSARNRTTNKPAKAHATAGVDGEAATSTPEPP